MEFIQEITAHSMDGTFQLNTFLASLDKIYGDQVSSTMSDRSHIQVL